jgi:hypothetical protein
MTDKDLTSGRLESVVSVLLWLDQHKNLSSESLEIILVNQSSVTTREMAREGIRTAFELGFVNETNELIALSKSGLKIVESIDREDHKSLAHRVLLEILTRIRRDLLWVGSVDVQTIKESDAELFEAMRDTGLFARKLSQSAESFWNKIRSLGVFKDDGEIKASVGKKAEELSLAYEVSRLLVLERLDLAQKVAIVSENTLLGYDVLSYAVGPEDSVTLLHIEVKKLSFDGSKHFFFITKNEATQAHALATNYVFHLWPSLDKHSVPIIIPALDVLDNLPKDKFPDSAQWQESKVWI